MAETEIGPQASSRRERFASGDPWRGGWSRAGESSCCSLPGLPSTGLLRAILSVWPGPPGFRVHLCGVGFEPESCSVTWTRRSHPGYGTLETSDHVPRLPCPLCEVWPPYLHAARVLPGWFSQDPRPHPRGWQFSLRNVPPLTTAARTTLHRGCKSAPSLVVAGVEPKPSLLPQNPGRLPAAVTRA